MTPPVVILAGPNGAGKSTAAGGLLPATLPFVNADEIAKTLPDAAGRNVAAGRLMLSELDDLEQARQSFALETTLANRALAPCLVRLRAAGYQIALYFLWLPSVELAIARVAERVRMGGHDIPEDTVRRRYAAGVRNFVTLYADLVDSWQVMENIDNGPPRLLAARAQGGGARVYDAAAWAALYRTANHAHD